MRRSSRKALIRVPGGTVATASVAGSCPSKKPAFSRRPPKALKVSSPMSAFSVRTGTCEAPVSRRSRHVARSHEAICMHERGAGSRGWGMAVGDRDLGDAPQQGRRRSALSSSSSAAHPSHTPRTHLLAAPRDATRASRRTRQRTRRPRLPFPASCTRERRFPREEQIIANRSVETRAASRPRWRSLPSRAIKPSLSLRSALTFIPTRSCNGNRIRSS